MCRLMCRTKGAQDRGCMQGGKDGMPNFSSGAADAVQGAELDLGPLLELKQEVQKLKEVYRSEGDRIHVRIDDVAAEIQDAQRVVQTMLESGGSEGFTSWVVRMQGLEANFHSSMEINNLQIAQLEHEIKAAKSMAEKTTEQVDGTSRWEPTGETSRQGTDAWGAGEYSVKPVLERFAGEVQHCRRHIRRFVELELEQAAMELRERGQQVWQANR